MADKRDYKKEYRDLYQPGKRPSLVDVPPIPMFLVDGAGDPSGAAYQAAMSALYTVTFTLKMSRLGPWQPEGYFDYVLPPLEGFWWQDGVAGVDYADKSSFHWISVIRLPDFVTREVFDWAVQEATAKKKKDFSKVQFLHYDEGLCVQCMHVGSYDAEPETLEQMDAFAREQGYETDFTGHRRHHEIYLSDPRRTAPEKLKTVLRHPVRVK